MGDEQRVRQPGPVYDDAMKVLADDDVGALLSVVGVGGVVERLNVELTPRTMKADLLARTPTGIVHMEFVKDPKPDLGVRMMKYWMRVRERYPEDPIAQYLLVLGDGVAVPDRYRDGGVSCGWTVVRVGELDPAVLLTVPTTAAIAALGRGTTAQRAGVLGAAVARISSGTGADRGAALLGAAATLASVVLPRRIIGDVLKEAAVPVLVRDTPLGREIYDEGREEGMQQGRRAVLRALLRQRFGDHPHIDDIVEQLVDLPDEDGLAQLTAAAHLDDLVR